MKTVIYARLSREDEDKISGNKESRSIENQIKTLSLYASEHKMEVSKIYFDDGYSGSNLNRPQFNQLLKDAHNHKFNILIIKDFSRLGRRLHQVGDLIENTFPSLNIRVISVSDNFDSNSYNGNESVVLKNFLNDYYLKDFKRKCHNSLVYRANKIHLNYYPKYGYLFDKDGKEQIDPYASKIVKKIFELSRSMSYKEIADYLNINNILTRSRYQTEVLHLKKLNKKPATKWDKEKIIEILSDYEYCGHIVNLVKRKEGPIIIKNKRIAIVSEEDYQYNLKKRLTRKKRLESRINRLDFIYGSDNRKFAYSHKKSKTNYYYSHPHACISESKMIYILYNDCVKVLKEIEKDKDKFYQSLKQRPRNSTLEYSHTEIKELLKRCDEEYAKLLENYFMKKVSETTFNQKSLTLKEKMDTLNNRLMKVSDDVANETLLERKYNLFVNGLKYKPTEQVELIKFMIEKVTVIPRQKKEYDFIIKYKFEL